MVLLKLALNGAKSASNLPITLNSQRLLSEIGVKSPKIGDYLSKLVSVNKIIRFKGPRL